MTFLQRVNSNRLYGDGAMGSMLIAKGYSTAQAETMAIEHPTVIADIFKEYLLSGAQYISTCTFGANEYKLKSSSYSIEEIVTANVLLAKQCAAPFGAFVGYDCGSLGTLLEPFTQISYDYAYECFARQARAVSETEADFIILETFSDLYELKLAILAFKENTSLPILASMSFNEDGTTFVGNTVESFALTAQGLGVDVIGLNCNLGPAQMLPLARRLTRVARVPVSITPNAGTPSFVNGATVYDIDANGFALAMVEIAKLGIGILGGCCGTTPRYIAATIAATQSVPVVQFKAFTDAVCSASTVVPFDKSLVIGERVNPTGKPLLKQALRDGDDDFVLSLCSSQLEAGADLLDVNVGMSGIDECATMQRLVKKIQFSVAAPLQLDSASVPTLSAALRLTCGVPIVNSVNASEASLSGVLPLVKKYGCYVVCLPLDEQGIPDNAEGRMALVLKIAARAEALGIDKRRLLVDALTMAVSVDGRNPSVTLEVLRAAKEQGFKTVLGLSNVSFGLPRREIINATFYTFALNAGLSAAIINPVLRPSTDTYAVRLLQGFDEECKGYIAQYGGTQESVKPNSIGEITIADCIVKGLRKQAMEVLCAKVNADNYRQIMQEEIIPALNGVGALFEQKKVFLPTLIACSDIVKLMMDYVTKTYMQSEAAEEKDTIILCTVKGDVHDIGKNIVKAVLSNYGLRIIDLGKDVSFDTLLAAVEEYSPRYLGLSALMTTTLESMKQSVKLVHEYDKSITVFIGGAVVTEAFAEELRRETGDTLRIFYCPDAFSLTRKLN